MYYKNMTSDNTYHTEQDQAKIDVLKWVSADDPVKFLEYVADLCLQFLTS